MLDHCLPGHRQPASTRTSRSRLRVGSASAARTVPTVPPSAGFSTPVVASSVVTPTRAR
jgi:hypothetical protein